MTDILPDNDSYITISDSNGKFKKYAIIDKNIGVRKYGDYDGNTGFLKTYIKDSNNNIIFCFNELIEDCSSVIIIKLSNNKECVIKLLEV